MKIFDVQNTECCTSSAAHHPKGKTKRLQLHTVVDGETTQGNLEGNLFKTEKDEIGVEVLHPDGQQP